MAGWKVSGSIFSPLFSESVFGPRSVMPRKTSSGAPGRWVRAEP